MILHQKLNSLNRLACLPTTNLTRTTPQMSLEIILSIEPSPYCRLCNRDYETITHLITECEVMAREQLEIMEGKIPLPDMTWSIKRILHLIPITK